MSAPFCTGCGATITAGTRFCVKCGQPIGHAAPPPVGQTAKLPPPPPPPPMAPTEAHSWAPPPPPPPPVAQQPYAAPPFVPQSVPQPVKGGSGAGLWIGILVVLLLVGGAAGYWYLLRSRPHTDSGVEVAAGPTGTAPVQAAPQATPTPTSSRPAPTPTPESSTLVAAPTPNPTSEAIPENPDFAKKSPSQPKSQPAQNRPAAAPPPPAADPPPAPPARAARQTSGVLHAAVEVAQNGEVVFENLPGARLRFIFDHALWQPTISHQANGTQTLVMRSLKQGIQTSCDVRWEIVQ
jgi:hypothetical protein